MTTSVKWRIFPQNDTNATLKCPSESSLHWPALFGWTRTATSHIFHKKGGRIIPTANLWWCYQSRKYCWLRSRFSWILFSSVSFNVLLINPRSQKQNNRIIIVIIVFFKFLFFLSCLLLSINKTWNIISNTIKNYSDYHTYYNCNNFFRGIVIPSSSRARRCSTLLCWHNNLLMTGRAKPAARTGYHKNLSAMITSYLHNFSPYF